MRRALVVLALAGCGDDAAVAPDATPIVYDTCTDEPRGTPETLAEKAAIYDGRAIALHVAPEMPWVLDAHIAAGVDPTTATAADVVAWRSGENDGLWSGLYLASQAYRYAATGNADALDNLRRLLDGERLRMEITGVPGLFTRQLIPPGVAGISCPTDLNLYVPSPTKTANRWVMIGDDGCAQTADATASSLVSTTHCGLDTFAGWCFLDNVSQDEYAGHLFALGAIAKLVDVPDVRATATELLEAIGAHLEAHDLELVDWDGRATQWGKLHPGAGGDSDGYLAILGLSALAVTGASTYEATAEAWAADLDQIEVFSEGDDACGTNWNDLSMLAAAFHHLLWNDPREDYLTRFDAELMRHADKALIAQHNAWFDVMWAAHHPDDVATARDAACQLRQFPASNHHAAHDTAPLAPEACLGRQGESLAAEPFGVADRCAATFVWWQNPYTRRACAEEPEVIDQPSAYLLAYWMARYHGFVGAGD